MRRFLVAGQAFGGARVAVPTGATGILVNVPTVQGGASGSYLTDFPGDLDAAPGASTRNPSTGIAFNRWACALTPAPATAGGRVAVSSTEELDLVIELVGYYYYLVRSRRRRGPTVEVPWFRWVGAASWVRRVG